MKSVLTTNYILFYVPFDIFRQCMLCFQEVQNPLVIHPNTGSVTSPLGTRELKSMGKICETQ